MKHFMAQYWLSFGAKPETVPMEFEFLAKEYRSHSPNRYYHTIDHAYDVGDFLIAHKDFADNWPAVKLAADGHDAVYIPGSDINESVSAISMGYIVVALGFSREMYEEVMRLIKGTKEHIISLDDIGGCLLHDADYSILSADWDTYSAYMNNIRKEYSSVYNTKKYLRGRKNFIANLNYSGIYLIPEIAEQLEEKAVQNLKREESLIMQELEKMGLM